MKAIERIYKYMDYKGVKAIPFEKEIGLSNGYLGKQKKRNADLGEGILLKIIENCPDLNPSWLLIGKGKMLKTDKEQKDSEPKDGIPLIPLDAMAGFGTGSKQIMAYDTDKYVVPEFSDLQVDFMIRVKGSSMIPKYNSGDLVACKKLNLNDVFFQWNKVYVLDTEQGPLIKRISKSKKEEHILLISENKEYLPIDLHLSHVHALALVVGVIRLE